MSGTLRNGEITYSHASYLFSFLMFYRPFRWEMAQGIFCLAFHLTATMNPALLGALAAAIVMGAGKIKRSHFFCSGSDLVEHYEDEIGGCQKIPQHDRKPADSRGKRTSQH
ncbi:MAG: hypothetical protein L0287_32200 [Anaerolineae bacterium]|nr:hypothetical protein [Anaerolineae bacterium]